MDPDTWEKMINNHLLKAGQKAGEKWSSVQTVDKRMSASERVEQILDGETMAWEFVDSLDAYTLSERLYFLLDDIDQHDRDRTDAAEFWEYICHDPQPELEFLSAFATAVFTASSTCCP